MRTLPLLARLALRNLRAHWVKSVIVGGILFFGTFLFTTGSALLDSIQASMEKSVVNSLAGHLQLYSSEARDPLALFGDGTMGGADIGEIPDFAKVNAAVAAEPNVAAVVPMGLAMATVFGGNEIDKTLEALRDAQKTQDAARSGALQARVRTVAASLRVDLERRAQLTNDAAGIAESRAVLDRVESDAFWEAFAADPVPALDWLDGKLAPLAADGRLLYFRLLGTDLDQFTQDFDRFEIVAGEMVPPGKRGMLISKSTYERWVKNKVARELDDIRDQIHDDGKTIADDPALREQVARNARQYQRILFQLDPDDAQVVQEKLQQVMPDVRGDLAALLQAFLSVDDADFDARYDWFYREIAPRIRLYDVKIGDDLPIRSFTKSGYMRSTKVKVYGTFQFKGLEDSALAGAVNLVDMATFREMYGKMSEQQRAELADLSASVGVKDVGREDAEAALFGGGGSVETTTAPAESGFDEFSGSAVLGREAREQLLVSSTITKDEILNGLALNAAVLLKDPSRLAQTQAALTEKLRPLGVQVIDWRAASGLIGQFITAMQAILYVSIGVMLLVALVIINNAMVMATMERTGEIGTMRAIGAHRGFVMALFLVETVLLGLIAGSLGAGASAALIGWLHAVGIPAGQDVLVVLFAGPRLYPSMSLANAGVGLLIVLVVSLVATFYPARLAAGVPPVVALQGKE